MTGVDYLLSVYPISSQGLPEKQIAEARELERKLIEKSHADALEQVGIIPTSAKKIAAAYYKKHYTP
jgi:hypothetical protein